MILQGPLDLGEVDGDAVDLALDPAIYFCYLGHRFRDFGNLAADRVLPLSDGADFGADDVERLGQRRRTEQPYLNPVAKLRELATQ